MGRYLDIAKQALEEFDQASSACTDYDQNDRNDKRRADAEERPNRGLSAVSKAKAWDEDTRRCIEWFKATPPPGKPFQLYSGVWIANPTVYWHHLCGDIAAGPGMGRDCFGAVREDLRRLVELFGGLV